MGIDKLQTEIKSHIDTAEAKHKESSEDLTSYTAYRNSFLTAVDTYQALENDSEYGIPSTPIAKEHFKKGLNEVNGVLVDAAYVGSGLSKEITDASRKDVILGLNQLSGDIINYVDSYKKPLKKIVEIEQSYDAISTELESAENEFKVDRMINLLNIPSSYFDKLINVLNACKTTNNLISGYWSELPTEYVKERQEAIKTHVEHITNILKLQSLHSTVQENKYEDYVEVKITNIKTGEREINLTDKFYQLPEEKQTEILNTLALSDLKMESLVESATAPSELESYNVAITAFEQGNLEGAEKLLDQFLTDVHKLDPQKHPDHFKNKDNYINNAKKLKDIISEQLKQHEDFFKGQKLANSGDLLGAKKTLQKYLNEHRNYTPNENDAFNYPEATKQLLVRIAKVQIEEIEEKFKLLPVPDGGSTGFDGSGGRRSDTDNVNTPEYEQYISMKNHISDLKTRVLKGEIIDLAEEVAKLNLDEYMKKMPLGDILVEEKGREGLLELARKYRSEGKTDLARQYFRRYFADRLNNLAEKTVTIEEIRKKYDVKIKTLSEISDKEKEIVNNYKKTYGEDLVPETEGSVKKIPLWEKMYNKDGGASGFRKKIEDEVFTNLLPEEVMLAQQMDTSNIPEGEIEAWNEFAKMEGIKARTFEGVETFAVSDERLREIANEIPIAILITAASAGVAGVVAGAVRLGATTVLGALGAGATSTVAIGIGAGFAAEVAAFTLSSCTLNAIRAGEFNINTIGNDFSNDIFHSASILGAFKMAGIIGKAFGTGSIIAQRATAGGVRGAFARGATVASDVTKETLIFGAINGELTFEDAAMVIGLRVAHSKTLGKTKAHLDTKTSIRMKTIKSRDVAKRALTEAKRKGASSEQIARLTAEVGKLDAQLNIFDRGKDKTQQGEPVIETREPTLAEREEVLSAYTAEQNALIAIERAQKARDASNADNGNTEKRLEAEYREAEASFLRAESEGLPTASAEKTKFETAKKSYNDRVKYEIELTKNNKKFQEAQKAVEEAKTILEGKTGHEKILALRELIARQDLLEAHKRRIVAESAKIDNLPEALGETRSAIQAEAKADISREVVIQELRAEAKIKDIEANAEKVRESDPYEYARLKNRAKLAREYEIFQRFSDSASAEQVLKHIEANTNKENCKIIETEFKKGAKPIVEELNQKRDLLAKFIAEQKDMDVVKNDPRKLVELKKMEELLYTLDPTKLAEITDSVYQEKISQVQKAIEKYHKSIDSFNNVTDANGNKILNPEMEAKLREYSIWGPEGKPKFEVDGVETSLIGKDGKINPKIRSQLEFEVAKAIERSGIAVEDIGIFRSIQEQAIQDLQAKVSEGMRPEIVNQLVMDMSETMLYQMKLSNQRTLGEHGARHMSGNIVKTLEHYAIRTFERAGDGKYRIPGKSEPVNLAEAVRNLSPDARLMATMANVYHDIAYSSVSSHAEVTVTGVHPALSRIMIKNNSALRELFEGPLVRTSDGNTQAKNPNTRGNFEVFLEMMNSHDKTRQVADDSIITLPSGETIHIGKMALSLQFADNSAIASGEKLPPALRYSSEFRALMRDFGQDFASNEGYFSDKKVLEVLKDIKIDLGTTDYSKVMDAVDKELLEIKSKIKVLEEESTLSAEKLKELEKLKSTEKYVETAKNDETMSLAISRLEARQKRWREGLKEARNEINNLYENGNINHAEMKNALESVSDLERTYGDPKSYLVKFLNAPTSMEFIRMGETNLTLNGTTQTVYRLSDGYNLDIAQYSPDILSRQIGKMPGDYIDGRIQTELRSEGKTFAEMNQNERIKFLERMGLTEAEFHTVRDRVLQGENGESKWGKIISSNKDTAEVLRGLYIKKQGIDEWVRNPIAPKVISLDPFAPLESSNTMAFEVPKIPSNNSPEYSAYNFKDSHYSTSNRNLLNNQMPTTDWGYIDLYKNLQKHLDEIKKQGPRNATFNETLEHTRRVMELEATLSTVEARYASFNANEALTVKDVMRSLPEIAMDLSTDFGNNISPLNNGLKDLYSSKYSRNNPNIRHSAVQALEILNNTGASHPENIRKVQNLIRIIAQQQLSESQLSARRKLRTF